MNIESKMDKACELAGKYEGRDSHGEIYKGLKKLVSKYSILIIRNPV